MKTADTYASLSLFPNEHILGSLGRLHLLSGNYHFASSCQKITSDLPRLSPYIAMRPAYRDIADKLAPIQNLKPESIVEKNTPISLYRAFLDQSCLQELATRDMLLVPENLRNLNHASNWRWCQQCAQEDIDNHGIPYWRLEHQLPSVCRCSTHCVSLHAICGSCSRSSSVIKFNLLPPIDTKCGQCSKETKTSPKPAGCELDWLETAIRDIVAGKITMPPLELTRDRIQQALGIDDEKMVKTVSGRKAYSDIRSNLISALDQEVLNRVVRINTRVSPQMAVLLFNLQKILFRPKYSPGPIVILMMIQALFGSVPAYVKNV